jgi:hypothetical protein
VDSVTGEDCKEIEQRACPHKRLKNIIAVP